jgi:hypothetical protein
MEQRPMPIRNRASEIKPTMLSVYDGQELAGFILSRGGGRFESFDRSGRSRGTFPTQSAASQALPKMKGRGDG